MRASLTLRSLLLAAFVIFGCATGQSTAFVTAEVRGATVYLEALELGRALGVVAHADGHVLTWRGFNGPVTLFAGSADALVQFPGDAGTTDVALAAPVLQREGSWYVPLDALPLFGVEVPPFTGRPTHLPLPNGSELGLRYREDAPAVPAPVVTGRASWELAQAPLAGVRFFDGEGASLLLVDLALVPLAEPSLTSEVDRAIDRARESGGDHVLLLLVTAVDELPWDPTIRFRQDGRALEVSTPYRLLVEAGQEGAVSPSEPVLGAVLLPPAFSLYREMEVEWAGVSAVVRFRQ